MKASLEDALYAYKISKASQTAGSSIKYKPHVHNVEDKLWINKSLFTDDYAKSQVSEKLSSKRFGPFAVTRLIGKNAVELDLPEHIKIHKVVNISHTVPYYEQPNDISQPVRPRPEPVPTPEGEEYFVQKILNHRKRGRGFQFLTQMKGSPEHDSEWQPTKDFIDNDGTMNDQFLAYIKSKNILKEKWPKDKDVVGDDNRRRKAIV